MQSAGTCTPRGLGHDSNDAFDVVDAVTGPASDASRPADAPRPADASDGPSWTDIVDAVKEVFDNFTDEYVEPQNPGAPAAEYVGDMPCYFSASFRYSESTGKFFASCGGMTNTLFSSPDGTDWNAVGDVAGFPSNHIVLPDDFHLATHSMPDGFTILDGTTGSVSDAVDFSTEVIFDQNGKVLTFVPNNPSGAILIGGFMCIATSNLDVIDMDPAKATYFPGTLICYDYLGDGAVLHDGGTAYYTAGVNPTGIAAIDDERFAVLSTNGFGPKPDADAHINIFTHPAMYMESYPLTADDGSPITAQISHDLAVSSGGLILIGVQQPYNGVIAFDPNSQKVVMSEKLSQVGNFVSDINFLGDIAAMSDFGAFGGNSAVLFMNVSPLGWNGVVISPIEGNAGPAVIVDGVLYQSSAAGASDRLWALDMNGMK